MAVGAFNARTRLHSALKDAHAPGVTGQGDKAFLLCQRYALPAKGVDHHLLYLQTTKPALNTEGTAEALAAAALSCTGTAHSSTGTGKAVAVSRSSSVIAQCTRSAPVDARHLEVLNKPENARAFGGAHIDQTHVVLALNFALPASWLGAGAGGMGRGAAVRRRWCLSS